MLHVLATRNVWGYLVMKDNANFVFFPCPLFLLTELLLEKLNVKLPQVETNLESLYSVLERSPNLTSVHISGLRLSRGHTHDKLLQTITRKV